MVVASATCLLVTLGFVTPASAAEPDAGMQSSAITNAGNQISALQALKKNETKTDAKIDSKLLVAAKSSTDRSVAAVLPRLGNNAAQVSTKGTVSVDIRATKVTKGLLNALAKSGAAVHVVSEHFASIRADVPLTALQSLAARADVKHVEAADGAMTDHATPKAADGKAAPAETKEARDARIAAAARQAAATPRAGAITSEGDRTHNADTVRAHPGVTGVGVKICALSDGVDSLAASEASGELSHVDVLPGQAGEGDEGTAMLEIIHDVAPGAALGFATAFESDAGFADNIRALRFDAHCDVIVDDVGYFKESPFQDWIIAQAVNDVTADGAQYFSSAGNEGNTIDGTAGHWEGDFVDSGQSVGKFAGTAHDFDPGPGIQIYEPISDDSSANVPVTLNWSDPLGASNNDYDLYLLDSLGNVVSFSQDVQNGTQDPYERLNTPGFGGSGLRLAVVKFRGADRYFSLSALRGRFSDSADGLKAFVTPGVTFGHSAAKDAFSVAAAPASVPLPFDLEPGDPANPAGPYPNAFSKTSKLERFTSDGPRHMFYAADGTPYTPGNVSSSGGQVRQKPDITAADGVRTSVSGFDPFFGTSAAAPHAAAIAGLVLSGNPGISSAELREAFINTAIDLAPAGVDPRSGHGVVLANRVISYTGASPQPLVQAGTPTIAANDGGQYVDPGDTVTVTLPVTNVGDASAVSTSVVLTSSTPGVTIQPRSRNYGTVAKGATKTNTFTVVVPSTQPVGVPVVLNAKVSFAGALSPTTQSFPIPIGRPDPVTHDFAYSGAPVAIPDNSNVGASVTIPVSGIGRPSKLTFSIDGTACSTDTGSTTVGIDHTYVGDLVGELTAPDGTTATLFSQEGSGGNNLCQVVFDDAAANPFSSVTSGRAPFTGTWRPQDALAGLENGSADGTWTFKITDVAAGDSGSIRAVSLHINGFVTA
ncbi:S8 family serine peptidase [Labedaea rhizosphaerae]|uniref:Proprotein convertase P-domain-containing protein n=1 Tax=Labedaea rhizosphaerae TaxID=598644 RepID=A0A4R6S0K8_LABRH|nr:S8 family serine peptidase [Labedaea rhizosphaerae]TDP92136.1 proprotein convertase P-domain-containing protein [Labedaea rhizosphaerae]